MDEISRLVHSVAQAPARIGSKKCERVEGGSRFTRTRALTIHRTSAVIASRIKPGQITPNLSLENPSSNGGKKPPSPPMAPTSPVTVPVSVGKCCGTNLKTAPLAKPSNAEHPSAPTVNGIIEGQASSSANGTMPRKAMESTRAPPISSESQPPIGRRTVARTTKPAVRNPASAGSRWNSSLRRLGR